MLHKLQDQITSIPVRAVSSGGWPSVLHFFARGPLPVTLPLSGGVRYHVRDLMDVWVIKETNLDREYERRGVPIQDGWTIVDIGAGLGDFSVFAAKRSPSGHIFSYEPFPDSFELLKRNLDLNKVSNVKIHPFAVSAFRGEVSMYTGNGVAVQHRVVGRKNGNKGNNGNGADKVITVPSVTLADVLAPLPSGTCDFLKMDCEGAEYGILLGAEASTMNKVKRLCLEYHDNVTEYSHTDLAQHLEGSGWQVRVQPNPLRRDLGHIYAERL